MASKGILGRKLGKWCLGLKEYEDPFLPKRQQLLFALYSIAATGYMWVVSISILFFLYHVFEGNGLRVLGHFLAAAAMVSLALIYERCLAASRATTSLTRHCCRMDSTVLVSQYSTRPAGNQAIMPVITSGMNCIIFFCIGSMPGDGVSRWV